MTLGLAAFLTLAAPLASIAWKQWSDVLMGHITPRALLLASGASVGLAVSSLGLGRFFRGLDRGSATGSDVARHGGMVR